MIAITRIVVTGFAPRIQAKIIPINVVGIDKRTSVKKDNTASIHFPPSPERIPNAVPVTVAMIMPVIALSVGPIANVARLTRSSLLDVIGQEHLDCARAKGMREWKVVLKHGLRNALIPVITILGAQLSAMIGGSVVVETVFAWPGIGTLIVSSAQQRDFPVVVFGVLVISASVTFVNLLVDLSYGLLDPRIRDH